MSIVDFTEIVTSMEWELFAQAFFRSKGFVIVEGPSVGSDSGTGKDLIIEEVKESEFGEIKRRFLVSCKHYAHRERSGSVKESDEKNSISVNLSLENCDGFIGFYSTYPTSTLLDNLRKLKEKENQIVEIFDKEKIEEHLLCGDKDNDLLRRFFEKSYRKWRSLGKKHIEQNTNFKKLIEDDFKVKDNEYYKKYYEGQPADWSIIRKYTFKRDSFDYVIKQLDGNKVCLVTGAGGEGKTTLLMQVADHYFKNGHQVFYCFDSIQNINVAELKFKPNEKYLLIIDNSNTIENLTNFISKIKLTPGAMTLLASRKNEWLYSMSIRTDSKDLLRWIGKETTLHKLSTNELNELSDLLQKRKVLNEEVKEKLPDFLKQNTNFNFLLSVMIYATQGKSFNLIIADVISKLQTWENSELTIQAIGYIVCIEVLGRGTHGMIYCHEGMLKKLININNNKQYQVVKRHLAQEAFFQGSLNHLINTRNPLIAKLYFDCLFNQDTPLLNKYEFYYNIIRETSISNRTFDRDILALIPKYFYTKDKTLAVQLVKDAISHGFFWNTYYDFVNDEISNGNIGSYDSKEYSARWLFMQAYSKNVRDPSLYIRWAKFELNHSNIGDIKLNFSPRWIFHSGMKMAPSSNLFALWANEEIKENNIGKNINEDYSARWICKQGFDKTPSSELFVTWASIEANEGNIGKDVNEDYSARWICKQGFDRTPSSELFVAWANIEVNKGNIGENVNETYSARWIFHNGMKISPTSSLFVVWAQKEIEEKNIGKNIDEEYSARWICKQGFDKTPSNDLFITWANIEANARNIGKDVKKEYSARWICKQGFDKTPSNSLFITWANIEANEGNIGKDFNVDYSARWICKQGFDKTPSYDLFITWANIEANAGNIGKDVKEEYSARWICKQGFDKTPSNDLFITWARIEKDNNNIGNIETPYTSRWLFKHGLDIKYDLCLFYPWLKLELKQGNIGSSKEPYSGQWLFENIMKIRGLTSLISKGIEVENALELKEVLDEVGYDDSTDIDN